MEKAIMDFEIGLKHQQIPEDILLELRYRLADCYNKSGNLVKALGELDETVRNQSEIQGCGPAAEKVQGTEQQPQSSDLSYGSPSQSLSPSLPQTDPPAVSQDQDKGAGYFGTPRIEYVDILAEVKAQEVGRPDCFPFL